MKWILCSGYPSFKRRLTWILFGFGVLPAILLTGSAYLFEHRLESHLAHDSLRDEIGELIQNPISVERHQERGMTDIFWKGYPATPPPDGLPKHVRVLKAGFHQDISWRGHDDYVLIQNSHDGRAYVGFDVSGMEHKEFWFSVLLLAAISGITFLAAGFSRRIAQQISRPLEELNANLSDFDPNVQGQHIRPKPEIPELNTVVDALNNLFFRIETHIEREQRFAQTASHELRTPLTVISGAVELVQERYGDEDPALQRIRRATGQMRETVESLLALARDSDDLPGQCHLDALLPELVLEYDRLTTDRPIRVKLESAQPCIVSAPERLICILVQNLLRNAIQNTLQGEIRVRLQADRLEVTDTGKGMSPDRVASLLDSTCLDPASRAGSGLGLYIVDQICRRFGWMPDIKSELGTGTKVTIRFEPEKS